MDDAGSLVKSEAAPSVDALIGQTLGDNYLLLQKIGGGGYGSVYRATSRSLNKPVAIKVLNAGLLSATSKVDRFEKEAHAVSKLSHPGIVRVIDYSTTPCPYMVMELVEGESLDALLKRKGSMGWPDAADVFMQVCDALSFAYAKGIVHRDVKPGNIMLVERTGGSYEAKILDFGLAKVVAPDNDEIAHLTTTGKAIGSPPYMSPEQCKGLTLDTRSDIYSAGCTLFEALTGCQAFAGDSIMHVMLKHVGHEAPQLVHCDGTMPSDLQYVIDRCLALDAHDRYNSFGQLKADLQRVRDGQTLRRNYRFLVRQWANRLLIKRRAQLIASLIIATVMLSVWFSGTIVSWSFDRLSALGSQRFAKNDLQSAEWLMVLANLAADHLPKLDHRKLQTLATLSAIYKAEQKWTAQHQAEKTLAQLKQEHDGAALVALWQRAQTLLARKSYALCEPLLMQVYTDAHQQGSGLLEASAADALAKLYKSTARLPEAEKMAGRAVQLRMDLLDDEDASLAASRLQFGRVLLARGEYALAKAALLPAVFTMGKLANQSSLDLAQATIELAAAQLLSGDRYAADASLDSSRRLFCDYFRIQNPMRVATYEAIVAFLIRRNQLDAIVPVLQKLEAGGTKQLSESLKTPLADALQQRAAVELKRANYQDCGDMLKVALRLRAV